MLDRIDMTWEQTINLEKYLTRNRNIPTPAHITHASSIYVEGLQVVHHIANSYIGVVGGASPPRELSFVNPRDMTINQRIRR